MKFATAIVALAATAVAVPTNGGGGNPGQCNNNNPNYVCCNGLLGGLLCLIDVGNTCSGGSYCCKSAPQVSYSTFCPSV